MFHFRQFSVSDDRSSMKVGTDAVLLGAWAELDKSENILDIGTGCGILALMAAQRSKALIQAIDIDPISAEQAAENFRLSPWSDRISVNAISFQEFITLSVDRFDHILCNPPFFTRSLKSPLEQRNQTRHNDVLPVTDLLTGISLLLTDEGKASFVLPAVDRSSRESESCQHGLFLSRASTIFPKEGKPAERVLLEFSKIRQEHAKEENLIILDTKGNYTAEYKQLTADFYLGLP